MKNWIKYSKFEEKFGFITNSRKVRINKYDSLDVSLSFHRLTQVFERAVEFYGEDHMDENLFVAFSRFEERQKEVVESRNFVGLV